MAVRWQIHFKSLSDVDYYVDIYDSTFSGTATQLTGAAMPFTTTEDNDEDMYIPIRSQSGYIRFIVENSTIVNQIRPVQTTDRPVVFRDSHETLWMGFLRPEQYSQQWGPTPYEIEIPIMSVMEAMQGVMFTQDEGYTSLFTLVRTINSYFPKNIYITAPQETPVKDVYVQNNNFREYLTIPERNERSTANKYECISLYECVEQFCQYFGISLHEYKDTFYFVVYPDTNVTYYDIDTAGSTQPTQYSSHTLASLTICGANNKQSYSKVYRRIKGEFDTNSAKVESIYAVSEFFKMFSVNGTEPLGHPQELLFNGNAEILPYKNGSQTVGWINFLNDYGGQILRVGQGDQVARDGFSWDDSFFVQSQKTMANTPSSAIKFNIPTYVYLNANEYAALNINFRLREYFRSENEAVKRVYFKFRIGTYWLKAEKVTASPATRYTWSTTESICWINVDNGNITMKDDIYTIDLWAEQSLDSINGFAIDMPSGLAAGYYSIYFELLCNADSTEDFGDYSVIGYLINNLSIGVLRCTSDISQPTPDFDHNNIIRLLSGLYNDDYMIGCTITTRRGTQYGAGAALTAAHEYVSTKYDELGVVRRAAIMNKSRELLTVMVKGNALPIESVTNDGRTYGILSQSIDWRNEENELQLINLD